MRQSRSSAAAWRKTIVPARPKNLRTPRTTCKTDLCNKIGHEQTHAMQQSCEDSTAAAADMVP
jgi:hypothetical protein